MPSEWLDLVSTTDALNDVDHIQEFVAQDRPAAAYRLALALIDRTEPLLSDSPMAGRRGRAAGTRELVVSGTLNIVVYRVHRDVEVMPWCTALDDLADEVRGIE